MRKSLICILLLLITYQVSAKNSNYTVCKNKFALCTTALCDPIPGKKVGFLVIVAFKKDIRLVQNPVQA